MTPVAKAPSGKGWFPNPFNKGADLRYFDGARWTERTRPIPDDYERPDVAEKKAEETPAWSRPAEARRIEPKKDDAPSKPAKNGTMPMFAKQADTGTVKAPSAKKADKPEPEKKPTPEKKPGGWATPDPAPEGDANAATTPHASSPAPAKTQDASKKAAPGGWTTPDPAPEEPSEDTQPEAPTNAATRQTTEPAAPTFAKPATSKTPEPSPFNDTVDPAFPDMHEDAVGESADEVSAAFSANPAAVDDSGDFDSSAFDAPEDGWAQKMKALLLNRKTITWAVTVAIAAAAIIAPMLVPAPMEGVPSECKPLADVLESYEDRADTAVGEEQQAQLAAVLAEGALSEDMTTLVKQAAEGNDMTPVLEHCEVGD